MNLRLSVNTTAVARVVLVWVSVVSGSGALRSLQARTPRPGVAIFRSFKA